MLKYVGLSATAGEVLYEFGCDCGGFGGALHVHIVRGPVQFALSDRRRWPVFSMQAFVQRFGSGHNFFPNTLLPRTSEWDDRVETAWKNVRGPSRASEVAQCNYARVRFLTDWRPPEIIRRCVAVA